MMMKTTARLMLTVAAAGLALSPIAAQANTRASDSNATYSVPSSQPGMGRSADGESIVGPGFLAVIAAAAAALGVYLLIDDDSDTIIDDAENQSPGA
jgi:ABC-type sugar transport system substrate-binding protein